MTSSSGPGWQRDVQGPAQRGQQDAPRGTAEQRDGRGGIRLVLNGPQRGTLWEDGRCSDMGITLFAPDFATWYLRWLRDLKPR